MAATHGDLPEELWLARHEPDLDNIRAALEWSQVHDVDTAARIIGSLHMFWNLAGLDVEARRRSEAVLAALGEDASRPEYMRVWIAVGWAAHRMFDTRRGLEAGEVALEMARKGNDRLGLAEALATVGMSHHRFGTDPARAHAALKESLEAYRAVGKPLRVVYAIIDYASSLVRSGNLEEARGYLAEAADLARASNWARALRNAEANLAEVVFVLGGVEEACALGRRCVEMYRSGHSNLELANALANLASYLSIAGRAAEAVDAGREAMVHAKPYVAEAHIAVAAQALALCAARDGNARTAARLMGFVDAVYERRGAQREPTEAIVRRGIVEALDALGDAVAFQDEIRRGRELDLDGGYRLGMNTHSTFES
jgi:tetratricopeptide (TPR) repeat protein